MTTPPRTDDTPFDARVVRVLAGVAVASFVAGLVFAITGAHVDEVRSYKADTFSRSAVGHRGLLETLRRLDVPLVVSRHGTAAKAGAGTVLVLLQPTDPKAAAKIVVEAKTDRVLVVLPKWAPRPNKKTPAHVESVRLGQDARVLMRALEVEATPGVVKAGPPITAPQGWPTPTPATDSLQTLSGLERVVSINGEALVAKTTTASGKSMWLVAEPDLLNNAGLALGENAALALALLADVAQGGRTLVLDETSNGYLRPPEIFSALFEFPLVLVLLHTALLVLALLWAAMRRFGAPRPPAPAFGRGREALMESTAALMRYGGHSAHALREYWRAALRQMREATGAPSGADRAELLAWLDRVGASRGVSVRAHTIDEAVRAAARSGKGDTLADAARRVHAFREKMLSGAEGP